MGMKRIRTNSKLGSQPWLKDYLDEKHIKDIFASITTIRIISLEAGMLVEFDDIWSVKHIMKLRVRRAKTETFM